MTEVFQIFLTYDFNGENTYSARQNFRKRAMTKK